MVQIGILLPLWLRCATWWTPPVSCVVLSPALIELPGEWEGHGEQGASSRHVRGGDGSTVDLHDRLRDGQSQASPAVKSRARGVGAIETVEHVPEVLGWQTWTVVADLHARHAVAAVD